MDKESYKQICREASQRLRLPDIDALGRGDAVIVDNIIMEMAEYHQEDSINAYLFVEVGVPAEDRRAEVYQSLLSLQLLLVGAVEGMFVYDAVNDRILFAARMPFWRDLDGNNLSAILRSMAAQAATWRSTLLAGKLDDALDPRQGTAQLGFGMLV